MRWKDVSLQVESVQIEREDDRVAELEDVKIARRLPRQVIVTSGGGHV